MTLTNLQYTVAILKASPFPSSSHFRGPRRTHMPEFIHKVAIIHSSSHIQGQGRVRLMLPCLSGVRECNQTECPCCVCRLWCLIYWRWLQVCRISLQQPQLREVLELMVIKAQTHTYTGQPVHTRPFFINANGHVCVYTTRTDETQPANHRSQNRWLRKPFVWNGDVIICFSCDGFAGRLLIK